jgi:hypothetical protein
MAILSGVHQMLRFDLQGVTYLSMPRPDSNGMIDFFLQVAQRSGTDPLTVTLPMTLTGSSSLGLRFPNSRAMAGLTCGRFPWRATERNCGLERPKLFRTQQSASACLPSPGAGWLIRRMSREHFKFTCAPFRTKAESGKSRTAAATYPEWSRNGRELFFETLDNRIMVVNYLANGDSFVPEIRRHGRCPLPIAMGLRSAGAVA